MPQINNRSKPHEFAPRKKQSQKLNASEVLKTVHWLLLPFLSTQSAKWYISARPQAMTPTLWNVGRHSYSSSFDRILGPSLGHLNLAWAAERNAV